MKKTVIISSIKQAEKIKHLVSAFIVPLKDLSINYENTFTISEIKKLKELDKELFISINKNIHNEEINQLKNALQEIEKLNINGIIFYDIALINIKNKLKLKTPLVWAQEHLTTNYATVNYWYEKGAKYAYLSSEITKAELDEIKANTKAKLFTQVFGYIPMFTSRRNLVQNYKNYFDLKTNGTKNTLHKENKTYPILDKKHGTTVFSDYILNALDIDFTNFDYIVYNSYLIDDNDLIKTLEGDNVFEINHGFLFKETIYKVKNHE